SFIASPIDLRIASALLRRVTVPFHSHPQTHLPMTSFRLTPQQLTAFNTFGFLAFPGLLNDRIDSIIENFEKVFVSHGGGHAGLKHDGKKRSCIVQFADLNPLLSSLIDDPRIHGIARDLVGEDFNYMGSDGNYY